MSTETVELLDDNNDNNVIITMNDDNNSSDNYAPRNALFCCSTPVCLNLSSVPQIIPIDFQQNLDGNHLVITTTTRTENKSPINENAMSMNDGGIDGIRGGGGEGVGEITTTTTTTTATAIPLTVPDLAKLDLNTSNGIIINGDIHLSATAIGSSSSASPSPLDTVEVNDNEKPKTGRKGRTPPPIGGNLGVSLKRVTPPKSSITVKKNDGPMLGVVLRRVEKKVAPFKSILDDDTPLYHLSIVRNDDSRNRPKPKPKPLLTPQQKAAAAAAKLAAAGGGPTKPIDPKMIAASAAASATAKTNTTGATNKPLSAAALGIPKPILNSNASQLARGLPITIQKIEGDKIIIIKKIRIPKNGVVPAGFAQNRASIYDLAQMCENANENETNKTSTTFDLNSITSADHSRALPIIVPSPALSTMTTTTMATTSPLTAILTSQLPSEIINTKHDNQIHQAQKQQQQQQQPHIRPRTSSNTSSNIHKQKNESNNNNTPSIPSSSSTSSTSVVGGTFDSPSLYKIKSEFAPITLNQMKNIAMQQKSISSPVSSLSLSSASSPSSSPPPPPIPNRQPPKLPQRTSSSSGLNRILNMTGCDFALSPSGIRPNTKKPDLIDFKPKPPDQLTTTTATATTQLPPVSLLTSSAISGSNAKTKLNDLYDKANNTTPTPTTTTTTKESALYDAEIDYMNKYLQSLPDYSELNKKIHKEFRKCEDIYDQIENINCAVLLQQQQKKQNKNLPQPLSKSSSYQSISNNSNMIPQTVTTLATSALPSGSTAAAAALAVKAATNSLLGYSNTASIKTKAELPVMSSGVPVPTKFTAYPSIFSQIPGGNKLTRSLSSTNMPFGQPIDHPDIPGFLPKIPTTTKPTIVSNNNSNPINGMGGAVTGDGGSLQKSCSNTSLNLNNRKLLNDFWSGNLAAEVKQPRRLAWNYEKIVASPNKAEICKDPFVFKNTQLTQSGPGRPNKLQKNMSLSHIDQKIRQNVSREELYKLMCNDDCSKFEENLNGNIIRTPINAPITAVSPSAGFINLNKSISLSNVPACMTKSNSKTNIPCYIRQFPTTMSVTTAPAPLAKSTSNTHLPSKNSILMSNLKDSSKLQGHHHCMSPLNKQMQQHPQPKQTLSSTTATPTTQSMTNPLKGLLKSSSSSCVFGGKYQPFYLRNNDSTAPMAASQLTSSIEKLTRTDELLKSSSKQQMQPQSKQQKEKKSENGSSSGCCSKHLPQLTKFTTSFHLQPSKQVATTGVEKPSAYKLSKTMSSAELEISKRQKDAENKNEKLLNEMLKITSNYSPQMARKLEKAHQQHQQQQQQLQQKQQMLSSSITTAPLQKPQRSFPIGKSNSTSQLSHPTTSSSYHRLNQLNQIQNNSQRLQQAAQQQYMPQKNFLHHQQPIVQTKYNLQPLFDKFSKPTVVPMAPQQLGSTQNLSNPSHIEFDSKNYHQRKQKNKENNVKYVTSAYVTPSTYGSGTGTSTGSCPTANPLTHSASFASVKSSIAHNATGAATPASIQRKATSNSVGKTGPTNRKILQPTATSANANFSAFQYSEDHQSAFAPFYHNSQQQPQHGDNHAIRSPAALTKSFSGYLHQYHNNNNNNNNINHSNNNNNGVCPNVLPNSILSQNQQSQQQITNAQSSLCYDNSIDIHNNTTCNLSTSISASASASASSSSAQHYFEVDDFYLIWL